MNKLFLTCAALCNRPQEDWQLGFIYLTMTKHSPKQCGRPAGGKLSHRLKRSSSDLYGFCVGELDRKLNFNLCA